MGESTRSTVMAEEEAKQKEALNATLKEYISEWRKTREKEEEELKKLKEKQAKRKEIRAEQERKLNQAKKEEEEKLRKEEADKRAAEAEEKKKRLEEAEAKRQEMLDAQKADKAGAGAKKSTAGTEGNDARKEMTKTKELNANSVRCPTVHFQLWRISCCNKYDFYSWYGSNDSDGTINSKEHYFCYNTNVKLCNA